MMKKTMAILLATFLAISLLTACGRSSDNGAPLLMNSYSASGGSSMAYSVPQASSSPAQTGSGAYDYDRTEVYAMETGTGTMPEAPPMPDDIYDGDSLFGTLPEAGSGGLSEKIIYTANADIETVDFDSTLEMVNDLLSFNNAFIENSYLGGRNYAQSYYGYQVYRTANYTLRIPVDRFKAVVDNLEILGNVISKTTNAENITAQFRDTSSRLTSYRIQEERLLAMLEKSETVTDMITIESRLADVRYSIESLTSTLSNWQNQVDYSTLTLYIREVEKLSETMPIQRTYWQQVGDGLQLTTRNVGEFFTNLFKWIVVNSPVLVILAIIVIVIVVIIKRKRSKKRKLYEYYNSNNNNNNSDNTP